MSPTTISFRNSLAGKIFTERLDKKRFEEYNDFDIARMSLFAAQNFVDTAIEFQKELAEESTSEESTPDDLGCDDCASCNSCDDEGYMKSQPGETFGAFLKRVYADRDAAAAKHIASSTHPLHILLDEIEAELSRQKQRG